MYSILLFLNLGNKRPRKIKLSKPTAARRQTEREIPGLKSIVLNLLTSNNGRFSCQCAINGKSIPSIIELDKSATLTVIKNLLFLAKAAKSSKIGIIKNVLWVRSLGRTRSPDCQVPP